MLDFKFSNALLHYGRSDAPKGFFWKYGLSYVLAGIFMGGVTLVMMRPMIEVYIEMFTLLDDNGGVANEEAINALFMERMDSFSRSSLLMFVVLLPLSLGLWAMFEASLQRHYIRKESFRLRFGNDEGRLMAVGLVVGLLFVVAIFASMIPMGVIVGIAASSGSPMAAIIGMIAGYGILLFAMLWYAARISAASALTIRDEKVRIFESFRVTKGRTLPIMGVLLIIWVVYYIVQTIIYASGIFAVIAQIADLVTSDAPESGEIMAQLQTPAVVGTIAAFTAVLMFTYGLTLIFLGGPGALAVLNDPDNPHGQNDPAEIFR